MSNLSKMLSIAVALEAAAVATPQAQRLELKRGKGGHFRLYVAIAPTKADTIAAQCDRIAEEHQADANLFKNAGRVEAVTFVDYDERKPEQTS